MSALPMPLGVQGWAVGGYTQLVDGLDTIGFTSGYGGGRQMSTYNTGGTCTIDGVDRHDLWLFAQTAGWYWYGRGDGLTGLQGVSVYVPATLQADGLAHTVVLTWGLGNAIAGDDANNYTAGSTTWYIYAGVIVGPPAPIVHSFPWVGKFQMCRVPYIAPPSWYILNEDGTYVLLESNDKIEVE